MTELYFNNLILLVLCLSGVGSQAQAGCENNIKRKLCWARHSQTEPDCRHC